MLLIHQGDTPTPYDPDAWARLSEEEQRAVYADYRAIALAEGHGPEAGLEIVDHLALDHFHYLHSTRGELLRRLGRNDDAREAFSRALALVHDEAERRLLERRLADLSRGQGE
jgi:predicted RNA polymerase sigma factor